jgi:hypothetical protein
MVCSFNARKELFTGRIRQLTEKDYSTGIIPVNFGQN